MSYGIDQSGKIEQTHLNTIIALSNDMKFTIILDKKTKRRLQLLFRNSHRPRMFIYQTFAALISLIFKDVKPKQKVIIDMEYFGHQDLLKKQIIEYIHQLKIKPIPLFEFGFVGKTSSSHNFAERVAYGKMKENKRITLKEIVQLIWPIKNDRVSAD